MSDRELSELERLSRAPQNLMAALEEGAAALEALAGSEHRLDWLEPCGLAAGVDSLSRARDALVRALRLSTGAGEAAVRRPPATEWPSAGAGEVATGRPSGTEWPHGAAAGRRPEAALDLAGLARPSAEFAPHPSRRGSVAGRPPAGASASPSRGERRGAPARPSGRFVPDPPPSPGDAATLLAAGKPASRIRKERRGTFDVLVAGARHRRTAAYLDPLEQSELGSLEAAAAPAHRAGSAIETAARPRSRAPQAGSGIPEASVSAPGSEAAGVARRFPDVPLRGREERTAGTEPPVAGDAGSRGEPGSGLAPATSGSAPDARFSAGLRRVVSPEGGQRDAEAGPSSGADRPELEGWPQPGGVGPSSGADRPELEGRPQPGGAGPASLPAFGLRALASLAQPLPPAAAPVPLRAVEPGRATADRPAPERRAERRAEPPSTGAGSSPAGGLRGLASLAQPLPPGAEPMWPEAERATLPDVEPGRVSRAEPRPAGRGRLASADPLADADLLSRSDRLERLGRDLVRLLRRESARSGIGGEPA